MRRRCTFGQPERLEDRTLLTTFLVTTTTDGATGSLRAAIADANLNPGADNIRFNASLTGQTILLSSSLPAITESLDIQGPSNSMDAIVVDGQSISDLRLFDVTSTAAVVTFRNLTITGGNIDGAGAGLRSQGPDTRLFNVRVTDNEAVGDGGGVLNFSPGVMTIRNSEISNNRTTGDTISKGAGVVNFNTDTSAVMVIDNTRIIDNVSSAFGGGVYNFLGLVAISRSTIAGNRATEAGGGIGATEGTTTISDSLIAHNESASAGGGLVSYSGTVLVTNTTIAHNLSRGIGGGLALSDTGMTLVNVTVARNVDITGHALGAGGIGKISGTLTLINTVVSQNAAAAGTATQDVDPADIDAGYNNYYGGNPRLGTLQDNGGPTWSMAPMPGSPLIDTGSSSRATVDGQLGSTPLQGDQRTFSRFVDGNLNNIVTVDKGAVEYNPGPDVPYVTGADAGQQPRITLYNQDGTVRWSKLAYAGKFTGGVRVAMGDVTGDGVQDVIAAEGPGGQSRFRVFDGVTGTLITGRSPFGAAYSGGLYVAAGDFNNDGLDDIVAGTGGDFISRVRIRNAANFNQNLWNMRVATPDDMDGVRVAVGDVNDDGLLDLITSRRGTVQVFDGTSKVFLPPVLHEFTPFGANFNGEMFIASGEVNGDTNADIIVGRGQGGPSRIRLYAGNTGPAGGTPIFLQEIVASDADSTSGVRVAARDIDGDGLAEIIAAPGPGGDPIVRTYWSATGFTTFNAFTDEFLTSTTNGLFVAIG